MNIIKLRKKSAKSLLALVIFAGLALNFAGPASAANEGQVYLGGVPFGVRFSSGSLTVSGLCQVDAEDGDVCPASEAGLKENDTIVKINGELADSALQVTRAVEESGGKAINLVCVRDGKEFTVSVTPRKSESSGKYRIGLWIKDSSAGIGTVTYVIPSTGGFGGLGHGICDGQSGELINIDRGIVCDVEICGVDKGMPGDPGELHGSFGSVRTGVVTGNTENGVFGIFTDITNLRNSGTLIEMAERSQISSGEAKIICTLDSEGPKEYSAEITCPEDAGAKSFSITVTDERLIEKTGGIVQGMSGSPVIQNGRLVGAVTHVLVGDAREGYGIYIDSMTEAMPDILK